jgi:hypothetical protein
VLSEQDVQDNHSKMLESGIEFMCTFRGIELKTQSRAQSLNCGPLQKGCQTMKGEQIWTQW